MQDSDFVYYQKGGKIKSLGYAVDSLLLEKGLPAVAQSGGGKGTANLIVPAGLLLLQQTFVKEKAPTAPVASHRGDAEVIDASLYDKLLELVSAPRARRRTRRRASGRRNRTRRKGR
jgi:hypothetical protein